MNTDSERRDQIIFSGSRPRGKYDILHFRGLRLVELVELVELDFIELDEQQNDAPTVGEIFKFMKKYPSVTTHGYVVTKERPDYRTSLEGVGCVDLETLDNPQFRTDFTNLFRHADEFDLTSANAYCWFD